MSGCEADSAVTQGLLMEVINQRFLKYQMFQKPTALSYLLMTSGSMVVVEVIVRQEVVMIT